MDKIIIETICKNEKELAEHEGHFFILDKIDETLSLICQTCNIVVLQFWDRPTFDTFGEYSGDELTVTIPPEILEELNYEEEDKEQNETHLGSSNWD